MSSRSAKDRQNAIDDKNISQLTPELIKELLPKIGLRLLFLDKWTATFGQHDNCSVDSESDMETVSSDLQETTPSSAKNEFALKREDAFLGKAMFSIRTRKINVKSMLNKTIQGQAILQSYKKTKILSRKCRNVIVDVLLSDILSETPRLTNPDFEYLAETIVKVFPTETTATYYIPPIPKRHSRTQKSIVSRGKLVDKYRNKIREFKQLTKDASSLDKLSTNISLDTQSDEETGSILDAASWLGKHTEPWELVVTNWKLTTEFRFRDNEKHRDSKVCGIFERWPILKHPRGYDLLEDDYASLKLSTVDLSVQTWKDFYTNLVIVNPLRKDDSNARALDELLQLEGLTDDSKVVLQLLLLPHIIPPRGRIRVKKNHWKPSISECKDSIIVHAVLAADTIKIQEQRNAAMLIHGLTVQPFIIAVGPSLSDVSTFYVCIDKVLYKVPSALKALDVCFKTFHAIEAAYPPESEHLWLLLQKETSGRRQNGEEEPFLVEEIPASPIMRGRRQNSDEERFVVENISHSPVMRGKRQNFPDERFVVENISASPVIRGKRQNFVDEPFLVQDIPRSPLTRGRGSRVSSTTRTTLDVVDKTCNVPGWNLTTNVIADPVRNTTTALCIGDDINHQNGPPYNEDDAPPSYESSIPPNHIGWSPEVASTIPFPMPHKTRDNDERLTFAYPPTSHCSPIELSPLVKSYLSIESPNSRSPVPSISPSPSPSPDRLRPAYTHQNRAILVARTPTRPQFRREYQNNEDFPVKPHNEFSYRYGGIIIAIFFVVFMMLLSLTVKFLIRNSFN